MKQELFKHIATVFLILMGTTIIAQQTVTGVVSEAQGPLPGVNILEKGTTNGAITDFDGNYSINVESDAVLIFSFVGFSPKEVPINGQTTLNVTLETDAASLDEIIVVGYGTQRKRDVSGAISQIKAEDIVQVVTANPTSALQGKLAGVQVESNGGAPGSPANVFVRGVSSLTNSFPLYVVDGTIVDDITLVNPKDIKDIQVLKDATSASIYGSRAGNGVIIITTNHGIQESAPKVNVDIRGGLTTLSKKLDFLNGPEYIQFLNQRLINDGRPGNIPDPGIDTDFQDLTINSGEIEDIGFNISGGGQNASYYFSSNYYNEKGLLIRENYERINTRLNGKFKIGKFDIKSSFGLGQATASRNNAFGTQGATVPIVNAFNPDRDGGFEYVDDPIYGIGGSNKFALANLVDNNSTTRNFLGNVNISYRIIEGLTARINLGMDYRSTYSRAFQPTFDLGAIDPQFNQNPLNDLTEVRSENIATNVEPTLNYIQSVEGHNFNLLLGGARQDTDLTSLAVYVEGLPSNNIQYISNFGNLVNNTGGGKFLSRTFSYFGRLNYNFKERYFLTGIVRRDATSKFSSKNNNNIGGFPSFSAAWLISNEDFWSEDFLFNTVKIRSGYGEIGSQNIPDFAFQPVLGISSNTTVGGVFQTGFAITSLVDEDISFETSSTFNLGVDLGLLNNSLTIGADYFKRTNRDVLIAVAIPATTGSKTPVFQNAATIENTGFEFEALYRYTSENDFNFNIGLNFAAIQNELTEAPNPILGPTINEENTRVNRFEIGQPLGYYFGFETDGIYNSQAEIDTDPFLQNDPVRKALLTPGDIRRVDINNDGLINEDDRTNIGDPTPDFSYGINFSGNYKKLDFSLFFNGQQGNEIYNVQKFFGVFFLDDNKYGIVRDAYTPQNPNTDIPRVSIADNAQNRAPSDFFVEDGSFLRLKTLELGYDLTESLNTKWVTNARVFFNVQNVFTISGYSGYDPEVGSTPRENSTTGFFGFQSSVNPIFGRGLDLTAQPRPRTFIVGLQLGF